NSELADFESRRVEFTLSTGAEQFRLHTLLLDFGSQLLDRIERIGLQIDVNFAGICSVLDALDFNSGFARHCRQHFCQQLGHALGVTHRLQSSRNASELFLCIDQRTLRNHLTINHFHLPANIQIFVFEHLNLVEQYCQVDS